MLPQQKCYVSDDNNARNRVDPPNVDATVENSRDSTVPRGKLQLEVVQVPYGKLTRSTRPAARHGRGGITTALSAGPIAHFRAPFQVPVRSPTRENTLTS